MKMLARLSFYAALLLIFVPAVAAVDSDSSPSLYCQDMLSKASLARFKSALKRHAANEEQQCDWAFALDTLINLPRVTTDVLSYEGGFRISLGQFGDSQYASFNYSYGVFTYDPKRNSVYVIGNQKTSPIAEFPVPEIVRTSDIRKFALAEKPLQLFTEFYNTNRVDTGISNNFRPTGLAKIDNALMLNYINWYDASGSETDTTIIFWNSKDLSNSKAYGPYQLQGAAHAAGWISEIPTELQSLLGGTHIAGSQPFASIISRLSVGPSAFSFDARENVIYAPSGKIPTTSLLDFSLKQILRDKSTYPIVTDVNSTLYNRDGRNKLWTILSNAAYGFIIPNTRTYLTIGFSGGHESGIGYKITQNNGNQCGGQCAKDANDTYPYYWAWDVSDLVKVKLGLMAPHDVEPYDYGLFPLPESIKSVAITSGSFDKYNDRLFISIRNGDNLHAYNRAPLFLVYKVHQ
ncbi:hypothetical protein [Alteromonas mediterranea]|uniref:hypothetical protein n=1 Tax=Alteromonas mediterranea TaxID=314275 RepID=UPI000355811E|nr:hypothetical protein [Alteromonas mediterranea]AGP90586.1 hypothetical protein I876_13695 [Alteromonas mediterranea U7]